MNNYSKKQVISIVGTTAIGKTTLGIKLAKHFKCDIISADSRQFFKEMNIGTAVPTSEELNAATHHFIQNRSIFDAYSVGDFERDAIQKINELHQKNDIVILLGGSGLYVNAVLNGLDTFPKIDKQIRENLKKEFDLNGIESLQKQLKELDEKTYKTIELNNPQRVIRALEICIGSGKTYSSFLGKAKEHRKFKTIKIGITAEREMIYDRINKRVDIMLEKGLLTETKKLFPNKELNALQTVGYKELFRYFDGEISLDFAIEEIKKNTRRFAKRQITWFKRDQEINWFDYKYDLNEIIKSITFDN